VWVAGQRRDQDWNPPYRVIDFTPPRSRLGRPALWREIGRLVAGLKPDVLHLHDPDLLLPAWFVWRFRVGRIIYDLHENVPFQILGKEWIPRPLRRFIAEAWKATERLALRPGNMQVVLAAEGNGVHLPQAGEVIHNYPVLEAMPACRPFEERDLDIVYLGGLTRRRGSEQLLSATELLPDGVVLHVIGDAAQVLEDVRARSAIRHWGILSQWEALSLAARARVGCLLSARAQPPEGHAQ